MLLSPGASARTQKGERTNRAFRITMASQVGSENPERTGRALCNDHLHHSTVLKFREKFDWFDKIHIVLTQSKKRAVVS